MYELVDVLDSVGTDHDMNTSRYTIGLDMALLGAGQEYLATTYIDRAGKPILGAFDDDR